METKALANWSQYEKPMWRVALELQFFIWICVRRRSHAEENSDRG